MTEIVKKRARAHSKRTERAQLGEVVNPYYYYYLLIYLLLLCALCATFHIHKRRDPFLINLLNFLSPMVFCVPKSAHSAHRDLNPNAANALPVRMAAHKRLAVRAQLENGLDFTPNSYPA